MTVFLTVCFTGFFLQGPVAGAELRMHAREDAHVAPGVSNPRTSLSHIIFLFDSFRQTPPPQNRQLILYYYKLKCEVDGFVGELTFVN